MTQVGWHNNEFDKISSLLNEPGPVSSQPILPFSLTALKFPDLIATKLQMPASPASLVARPHLLEKLEQSKVCKLVLVSAPAGYGKTSLAVQWIRTSQQPYAWVTLDQNDDDPLRFWSYVTQALEKWLPGVGAGTSGLWEWLQSPSIEQALINLLNRFSGLDQPFSLVLDDYHLIKTPQIHRQMAFWLEYLPPHFQVVLLSREDPPFPLARLRVRQQLVELRPPDLRFRDEEATIFLKTIMKLPLTTEGITTLANRTEGWVAALQLAALSMQGLNDPDGFVAAFNGTHRYILDYLVEEVMQRQSPSLQQFLLQTSILERMTGALVEAVTGCSDGHGTLHHLEQINLFVIGLDPQQRWYRYHHLFADYLRNRLKQEQPDDLPLLNGRAAHWYAKQGMSGEAISYALAARDFDFASDLIERQAIARLLQGEVKIVSNWLEALPSEQIWARPGLSYSQGWLLALTQQLEEAETWLDRGEVLLQDAPSSAGGLDKESWQTILAFARAYIASSRGDLKRVSELTRDTLEGQGRMPLNLRLAVLLILANAYNENGHLAQAGRVLEELISFSRATGNQASILSGLVQLAYSELLQGKLRLCCQHCEEALQIINTSAVTSSTAPLLSLSNSMVYLGLGELWREWNDLAKAEGYMRKGLEMSGQANHVDLQFLGYINLSRIKQAQGDIGGVHEALAQAGMLEQTYNLRNPKALVVIYQRLIVWLGIGQSKPAFSWADSHEIDLNLPPNLLHAVEYTMLTKIFLVQNRLTEARKLSERLLEKARQEDWVWVKVFALIFMAELRYLQGDQEAALATLSEAVELAEPEGFVRIFVDEDNLMATLLTKLFKVKQLAASKTGSGGPSLNYINRLLKAFPDRTTQSKQNDSPPTPDLSLGAPPAIEPLAEPLSERELEVLQLVSAGFSSPEIAHQLVLSVTTVKWHIKNIYAKLGVHQRSSALTRARELGLLRS